MVVVEPMTMRSQAAVLLTFNVYVLESSGAAGNGGLNLGPLSGGRRMPAETKVPSMPPRAIKLL